jgi:phosphatidylglycerol---prolipoprotein diacylglyceryl transferase
MSTGIEIGPFTIHWYGVLIMLGALAAAYMADRQARRAGKSPDLLWDSLPWVLLAGIVGSRLWHVFTPSASQIDMGLTPQYYLTNPLEILKVWQGGLGIPGGVIGGAIALYIFTRRRGEPFLQWADFVVPGVALAQAIGRWGNYVNQEVYGAPTDLPWAIFIDPQHRLPGFSNITHYHPLFFYESIWNIGNMMVLLWISNRMRHKLKMGDVFLSYLIIYPFGRFLLEFLRLDPSPIAGININQTSMLVIMVVAAAILFLRHRPGQQTKQATIKNENVQ